MDTNTNNMRDELNDVKAHAREAARATLLAMRTGIDAALGFLDERRDAAAGDERDAPSQPGAAQGDAPATSTTASGAQPEGSIVPPSMPDDKPTGGAND